MDARPAVDAIREIIDDAEKGQAVWKPVFTLAHDAARQPADTATTATTARHAPRGNYAKCK